MNLFWKISKFLGSVRVDGTATLSGGTTFADLTASTVPYLDSNKKLTSSGVTPTALGFLDATASIQTQINSITGVTISDWVAYTPTISSFGTPTGVTFYSRRVGDSLEVHGTFGSGVSTGSVGSFTIGYDGTDSNVTVNVSKISGGTACGMYAVGATAQLPSIVLAPGSASSTLTMGKSSASTNPLAGANADTIAGNEQSVQVYNVLVPITGW